MGNKILIMKDITKRFPGVTALKNVSFDVEEGEILALVGENGAGKSTLMKILSGSYPSSSYEGSIFINGQLKKFDNPRQSEEAGIAMIYQEISMHLDLTVAENLFLGHWPKNSLNIVNWRKMHSRAKEVLKLVKLDVEPGEILRNLNTSQMQLISIARALSKEPKILVLDEPTRGIDVGAKYEIYKIMMDLVREGISIIMISSELPELISMSDRVLVLSNGRIKGEFLSGECTQDQIMRLATSAGDVEGLDGESCAI